MQERTISCTCCPNHCSLTLIPIGREVIVAGNQCMKGEIYGKGVAKAESTGEK